MSPRNLVKILQLFILILFVAQPPSVVQGAKILFFLAGGTYSHKVSIWPFVTALADKGHNVTCVSPFSKRPYDDPRVKDVAPTVMAEAMGRLFKNKDRLSERLRGDEKYAWINYHDDELRACEAMFGAVPAEPELYRLFHGDEPEGHHYDVMINNVIFGDCGYVLASRLMSRGTKLILFDSTYPLFWGGDTFGYAIESTWIPDFNHVGDYPMGLWDRFTNYFAYVHWYIQRNWVVYPRLEAMMKKMYGLTSTPPSLIEVERSASLMLIATHYTTDFARSLPPFAVHVGGMQCWKNGDKQLEGEFKEFLDKATNGAILIAFGSTIDLSRMPLEMKQTFFDMVAKFPTLQFIWRWDGPEPKHELPPNLKLSKWLPQFEILGHPNLKAFISHAGLNSLTEATFQGKPVILLPLFGDQDYHGYRVQAYETGIRLEVRTLTLQVLEDAVREILTNKKYSQNMKKMSALMRDRPMNPIETAVYWTEFVLRHDDTSPLKPLNKLIFFQRRMWDIFLLAVSLFSLLLVGAGSAIYWLCVGVRVSGSGGAQFLKNGKRNGDGSKKIGFDTRKKQKKPKQN